jgi:hypothetical protein
MSNDEAQTTYCAFWLGRDYAGVVPRSVHRALLAEDAREKHEAAVDAEERRVEQLERASSAGMPGYRAGRTLEEVFEGMDRYFARSDAVADRELLLARGDIGAVDLIGRPSRLGAVQRSEQSARRYADDRAIEQAGELHRDLIRAQAQRDYDRAEMAARAKSEAPHVRRDQPTSTLTAYSEITRVVDDAGYGYANYDFEAGP